MIDKGADHNIPKEEIRGMRERREERESIGYGAERGVLGDEVGDREEVFVEVLVRPQHVCVKCFQRWKSLA